MSTAITRYAKKTINFIILTTIINYKYNNNIIKTRLIQYHKTKLNKYIKTREIVFRGQRESPTHGGL